MPKTLSQDQIERYQVARAEPPHRMLGAIVPRGQRDWFFKLTGDVELAAREKERFESFVKSVKFK